MAPQKWPNPKGNNEKQKYLFTIYDRVVTKEKGEWE